MWYREPFFKLLNDRLNIKFVFTNIDVSSYAHGTGPEEQLERLRGAEAVISRRILTNGKYMPEGIPLDLLKCIFFDAYDIVVDTVQSTAVFSLIASKLRNKPIILWLGFWSLPHTPYFKLKLAVTKLMIRKADALVVYGTKHKEAAILWGADPEKVFIMPNVSLIETDASYSVDVNRMQGTYPVFENALARGIGDKKIVLYVGKLVRRKGANYLIKAFSLLRREIDNTALLIIGDGSERDNLVRLSRSLLPPDSVFFLGRVKQSDLPFFFSYADVCVVPSVTLDDAEWGIHTEPWGLVMNEAMQFGSPMVATDAVGAAFDLIRNGKNGFVVPEKDATSLYQGLKAILEDDKLRCEMGEESKKIIEDYFQYRDMLRSFCAALHYVSQRRHP